MEFLGEIIGDALAACSEIGPELAVNLSPERLHRPMGVGYELRRFR